jgi:hypothetical protein
MAAAAAAAATIGTFRAVPAAAAAVPPDGDPHGGGRRGGLDRGWLRGDNNAVDADDKDVDGVGRGLLKKRKRNRKTADVVEAMAGTPSMPD